VWPCGKQLVIEGASLKGINAVLVGPWLVHRRWLYRRASLSPTWLHQVMSLTGAPPILVPFLMRFSRDLSKGWHHTLEPPTCELNGSLFFMHYSALAACYMTENEVTQAPSFHSDLLYFFGYFLASCHLAQHCDPAPRSVPDIRREQWLALCYDSHKAEIKKSASYVLFWRLWGRICFQVHSCCWQNSVPCGCRTEVPIFLLTMGWGTFWASRGHIPD
jgi:hypothetical protein